MRQVELIFIIVSLLISGGLSGCSHRRSSGLVGTGDACRNVPLVNAASRHDGYPQVQALLAQGANVNTVNGCGQTALSVAAELNNTDIVTLLLKHKADVDARTSSSASPLVLAAGLGNLTSAQLLLEHGADIEAKQSRWTPLIAAVDNRINVGNYPMGNGPQELIDMEDLLIDHGADVNAARGGKTALMVARRRHFAQTVALLKKAGATH